MSEIVVHLNLVISRRLWRIFVSTDFQRAKLIFFSLLLLPPSSHSFVFVCTKYRSYQIGFMHDWKAKKKTNNERVAYFRYQIRRVAVASETKTFFHSIEICICEMVKIRILHSGNGNQFTGKTTEWLIGADIENCQCRYFVIAIIKPILAVDTRDQTSGGRLFSCIQCSFASNSFAYSFINILFFCFAVDWSLTTRCLPRN